MSSGQQDDPLKCVIIGDACVGKTCMAACIVGRKPNLDDYTPTIFENTIIQLMYRGQHCRLEICDTAGQEEFAALRKASYTSVDLFMVCFCLTTRDSFENLESVWLPELLKHQGKARVMLIGTKLDLCNDGSQRNPIARVEIDALRAKYGFEYVECSARSGVGIQEVTDRALAVLHGVTDSSPRKTGRRKLGLKKCSIL